MGKLIIPKNYDNPLSYLDSEIAIKIVKDQFEKRLADCLKLVRVSAPLYGYPRPRRRVRDGFALFAQGGARLCQCRSPHRKSGKKQSRTALA